MIKVCCKRKDGCIYKVVMSGHAKYNAYGNDIVCAAASTIATTSVNAIVSLDKESIHYDVSDGCLEITTLKDDKIISNLLENMIRMLEELSNDYPKNITIRKEDE